MPYRDGGTGRAVAGQCQEIVRPRLWRPSTTSGVLACHGAAGSYAMVNNAAYEKIPRLLADTGGFIVSVPDLYGSVGTNNLAWGNDSSTTAGDAEVGYLLARGAAGTAVHLYGLSMGSIFALNLARRFPTKVKALALALPIFTLDVVHDANVGGHAASIEAAYGGLAGYEAALATHDPINFAASISAIHIDVWYAPSDAYNGTTIVNDFAAAHGNTTVHVISPDIGHDPSNIDPVTVCTALQAQAA